MLQSIKEQGDAYRAATYNQAFAEVGQDLDRTLGTGDLQGAQNVITQKVYQAGIKEPAKFVQGIIEAGYKRALVEQGTEAAKDYLSHAGELQIGPTKVKDGVFKERYYDLLGQAFKHDEDEGKKSIKALQEEAALVQLHAPEHPLFKEFYKLSLPQKEEFIKNHKDQLIDGHVDGFNERQGSVFVNILRDELGKERRNSPDEAAENILKVESSIQNGDWSEAEAQANSILYGQVKVEALKKIAKLKIDLAPAQAFTHDDRRNLEKRVNSLPDDTPEDLDTQAAFAKELDATNKSINTQYLATPPGERGSFLATTAKEAYEKLEDKIFKHQKSKADADGKFADAMSNKLLDGQSIGPELAQATINRTASTKTINALRVLESNTKANWQRQISEHSDLTVHDLFEEIDKLHLDYSLVGYDPNSNLNTGILAERGLVEKETNDNPIPFMGNFVKKGVLTDFGRERFDTAKEAYKEGLLKWKLSDDGKSAARAGEETFNTLLEATKKRYARQLKEHLRTNPDKDWVPSDEGVVAPGTGAESKPAKETVKISNKTATVNPGRDEQKELVTNSFAQIFNDTFPKFDKNIANLDELHKDAFFKNKDNNTKLTLWQHLEKTIKDDYAPDPLLLSQDSADMFAEKGFFKPSKALDNAFNSFGTIHPYPLQMAILRGFASKDENASIWLKQGTDYIEHRLVALQHVNISEAGKSKALIEAKRYTGIPYQAVLDGKWSAPFGKFMTLPIDGTKVPYQVTPLFQSEKELRNFYKDNPKNMEKLLKKLGINLPEGIELIDNQQFHDFIKYQLMAIERLK